MAVVVVAVAVVAVAVVAVTSIGGHDACGRTVLPGTAWRATAASVDGRVTCAAATMTWTGRVKRRTNGRGEVTTAERGKKYDRKPVAASGAAAAAALHRTTATWFRAATVVATAAHPLMVKTKQLYETLNGQMRFYTYFFLPPY